MPVRWNPHVALQHAALDFDCASCSTEHAAELDQETVAHHLDYTPAVGRDSGIEELAAMLTKGVKRLLFVGFQETAVAYHIGGQDSRQSALDKLCTHARLPNVLVAILLNSRS
ncbi:hypothetical protein GGE56_001545 [Rhizobium leguminosarum]|nr:hypothetical protein [Rhizobium leguminosarum]MBB6293268.1 hypothetical protein [Rhizobium leguminosarum]